MQKVVVVDDGMDRWVDALAHMPEDLGSWGPIPIPPPRLDDTVLVLSGSALLSYAPKFLAHSYPILCEEGRSLTRPRPVTIPHH